MNAESAFILASKAMRFPPLYDTVFRNQTILRTSYDRRGRLSLQKIVAIGLRPVVRGQPPRRQLSFHLQNAELNHNSALQKLVQARFVSPRWNFPAITQQPEALDASGCRFLKGQRIKFYGSNCVFVEGYFFNFSANRTVVSDLEARLATSCSILDMINLRPTSSPGVQI
jgi:hypothetical protein